MTTSSSAVAVSCTANAVLTCLEELSVRYEAVLVHVVDAEREPQLGELVALHGELRHALDKL